MSFDRFPRKKISLFLSRSPLTPELLIPQTASRLPHLIVIIKKYLINHKEDKKGEIREHKIDGKTEDK